MNVLKTVVAELVGLFVDDWLFALLVLAWVGCFAVLMAHGHGKVAGPVLFGGLAALVLGFVARKAWA